MASSAGNIGPDELHQEHDKILNEYNDRYRALPYLQVFHLPADKWRVEGLFIESFYRSARFLLQQVLDGMLLEAEGVAALYLCRHYLELALKYALFHSKWLKDENTNAADSEVTGIGKRHLLKALWTDLKRELETRVPSLPLQGLDLDFVGNFVDEFDGVDPDGCRFRYPTEKIKIGSGTASLHAVGVNFEALLRNLDHVFGVLSGLDSYLVETYGENQEWEGIQSDF
jgi:hypothetical protein